MTIGITGGIGSGKSTVANELRRLGYTVYDTDSEAKRLIVEDDDVRCQMVELLGEDIYEGNLYRTDRVAERVFSSPILLSRLNAIVHPAVARDIQNQLPEQTDPMDHTSHLFFIESAILYESGLNRLCDRVVLVTAPEDVRIARTIVRDHTSKERVCARIRAQKKDADIPADIRLLNDGNTSIANLVQELIAQL